MKSQSNTIQSPIWIRELENGTRHLTLRKNFTEKVITNLESEEETQYEFDETDVYITDRENIEDYINDNFDTLFDQGITQVEVIATENKRISETNKLVQSGQLYDSIQLIGQQITNIMLEV